MKRLSVVLALAGAGLVLLSALPAVAESGPERVAGTGSEVGGLGAGDEAVAPGAPDPVSYGRALFQAKGCTACHLHREVNPGAGVAIGPDLTEVMLDPAYLRAWLSDPASIRPGTRMPDLGLSGVEIEALIAFINDEAQ